jgi:ATP-dependent DNA helicase DinG
MNFTNYFDRQKLTPRPQQMEVLEKVEQNWDKYRYFAISAPTGVGKTHIALAIADSLSKSYLLTGTKDLQAQYERTSSKVVDLKGRSNYVCNINPIFNVDEAPCLANKNLLRDCISSKTCAYYNQKSAALKSQMMITNYAYFLTATANADEESDWVQRNAVIMDEAHDLEKHLISVAEIRLNLNDLHANFGVGDEEWRISENMEENNKLLEIIAEQMSQKIEEMNERIEEAFSEGTFMQKGPKNVPKNVQEKIRKINSKKNVLEGFVTKIFVYLQTNNHADSPWVHSPNPEENSIMLSPLTAKYLFRHMMDDFGQKHILVSATLPTKQVLCKELGINEDDMLYIEVGTPFEAEKSPIIVLPVGKMNFKEIDKSIPKIVEAVEAILESHENEKGLIHTGNYKVAKAILDRVDPILKQRLIARDMGPAKVHNQELLKRHYSSDEPTVLLSPSMTTGIDLYDDMARFQIIVKLPFPSLADPRIKRKSELFGDWYSMQMWVEVLQASGRATRNTEDYATTYILDASFSYFYNQFKSKLPAWFKDRIQM